MANRNEVQLVSLVFRAGAERLEQLKALAKRTRIRQSEFLREAIDDLLRKYEPAPRSEGPRLLAAMVCPVNGTNACRHVSGPGAVCTGAVCLDQVAQ